MSVVDDLQQLPFAEVGVRHDQLVHALAVEERGQVVHVAQHRQANAHGRRRDGADELVVDPAAARAERGAQACDVLAGARQQRVAPHAQLAKHLARDELVTRTEHRDGGCTEDHGSWCEPVGRELVPGADRERERDQRDQDQRGEHAGEARSPLALLIQVRLREDEHGDERQERQPVGLDPPEHAPEHRLAPVVELPRDEGRVEPEHEPAEVDADQRGDARKAAGGDEQLRAREQKRRAGPDVGDDPDRRVVLCNRGGDSAPPRLRCRCRHVS